LGIDPHHQIIDKFNRPVSLTEGEIISQLL
jgi:hypothetical protein